MITRFELAAIYGPHLTSAEFDALGAAWPDDEPPPPEPPWMKAVRARRERRTAIRAAARNAHALIRYAGAPRQRVFA